MYSKPATPKTLAREVKQTTRRSERDIQREIEALNRQEKQLVLDIKSAAKQNNTKTTNMYAKQLLQLRNTRDRLTGMKTQVASAGMQVMTLFSFTRGFFSFLVGWEKDGTLIILLGCLSRESISVRCHPYRLPELLLP